MNCAYCYSKIFKEDKVCSRCGAPAINIVEKDDCFIKNDKGKIKGAEIFSGFGKFVCIDNKGVEEYLTNGKEYIGLYTGINANPDFTFINKSKYKVPELGTVYGISCNTGEQWDFNVKRFKLVHRCNSKGIETDVWGWTDAERKEMEFKPKESIFDKVIHFLYS